MWKFIKFKKAGHVAWMASWKTDDKRTVFFFFFSFSRTCDRFIGKMVRSFFLEILRIESLNIFAMDILNLAVLCDLFGMVK